MSVPRLTSRRVPAAVVYFATALSAAVTFRVLPMRPKLESAVADATVAAVALVTAGLIAHASRTGHAAGANRYFALALALLGLTSAGFVVADLRPHVTFGPGPTDLAYLLFLPVVLWPARAELAEQFRLEDRREIEVDVLLIGASLACIGYLFMRPDGASPQAEVTAGVFSSLAAAELSAFGGLAVWVPSARNLARLAAFVPLTIATYGFGWLWVRGTYHGGVPAIDSLWCVGALGLAAIVVFSRTPERGVPFAPTRWGRPVLTFLAVAAAVLATALVAQMQPDLPSGQPRVLIGLLGAGVAVRILANQFRSTQANARVQEALFQKEAALGEADDALDRVREANETLRQSEEHLRLVFDTAVDGIVELDARDVVLRANEAFCRMVGLPRDVIEGQPWTALAAAVRGADPAFASLPSTGQGTIVREGQPLYLESRASKIPMTPPRRLLLVRDVTAGRVADQTIRSLFQFLQDRDEDRTRLLRRTNAAIESERNRIARDLHDGPVQGVSAASLSLEAALLMIGAGDVDRGIEVLSKVRMELSEEADALRQLMAGLRPPLLEERGLIPALRDTILKFGHDHDVQTEFSSGRIDEIPDDLQTLAFRVVQEALSNAGKHANPAKVSVHVETTGGQLRVEVSDDGDGFDAAMVREFLRLGRVGLASMRERVELASGTLVMHSAPERGTTILAVLPLDQQPAAHELAAR